jgi:hypothetical protein
MWMSNFVAALFLSVSLYGYDAVRELPMFSASSHSSSQSELERIEALPEMRQCVTDEDCISVQGDCCGCGGGGSAQVINKTFVEHWQQILSEKCADTMCPMVMSEHWTCHAETKCMEGQCVFINDLQQFVSQGQPLSTNG